VSLGLAVRSSKGRSNELEPFRDVLSRTTCLLQPMTFEWPNC
jgi:hypothetical protein